MADFSLRPMEPGDGPAIDLLMRTEAQTTSMSMTTHYQHDVYQALLAQHPTLYGVVAEAPDYDGLVGMATAFTDAVSAGGRILPSAHLENLKVRHDVRRQGLGSRLAAWRIDEARRHFGGDGVITTGVEISNTGSLATARHWSTQTLGPIQVVVARVLSRPPTMRGITVRPIGDGDLEAVVAGVNGFYAGYDLFPPQTAAGLAASLQPTALGLSHRQYRVAVREDGTIVAGALVSERFKLLTDHLEHIPRPLALMSRVVPLIPSDGVIRSIELALAWHAPNDAAAGRHLWDTIRHEWRDRATHATGQADPRGPLFQMLRIGPTMVPKVRLMIPVQSPVPVGGERPVYVWR
jgi:GNAT superfamily N-acetyltransferase